MTKALVAQLDQFRRNCQKLSLEAQEKVAQGGDSYGPASYWREKSILYTGEMHGYEAAIRLIQTAAERPQTGYIVEENQGWGFFAYEEGAPIRSAGAAVAILLKARKGPTRSIDGHKIERHLLYIDLTRGYIPPQYRFHRS